MKISKPLYALSVIFLTNAPSTIAAEQPLLKLSEIVTAEQVAIDPQLEEEINQIEDQLISAFNERNKEDDFQIICQKETQNGSFFFKACDPRFLLKARQANSRAWRNGLEELLTEEDIRTKFDQRFAELDRAFDAMLADDHNLRQLVKAISTKVRSAKFE